MSVSGIYVCFLMNFGKDILHDLEISQKAYTVPVPMLIIVEK